MEKKLYLYRFKHNDTGLFKRDYKTIRYKTRHNAESALEIQKQKTDYHVAEIYKPVKIKVMDAPALAGASIN